MSDPLRIAMWSGPRNISTAMMRAWENRGDCAVTDEPLYAAFLAASGIDHPGRDEVIAAGETDVAKVVAALHGPVPGHRPIWYQKHMAHHLLPSTPREWIPALTNLLLIRNPGEVVASYLKSRSNVTAEDIGLAQQVALYDEIEAVTGVAPPVIDAGDFLRAPEAHLRALCASLGIEFTPRMLTWPAGRRESDGIWAPYWYAAVEASTGFEPWRPRDVRLDGAAAAVAEASVPHYRRLHSVRIVA
ncbi:MAG: HAD family hydrolase [Betaproteobacteria bacterium]